MLKSKEKKTLSRDTYRPDIDGIRALAVLAVVIYHAFPAALPGGFSGVDIFFVISGYLISGILYSGLYKDKFSFAEFYSRRIRRLFPALVTMFLLTLGAGYYYLLSDEFEQLGKHMASSCIFIQNIVFLNEAGYFDTSADLKPLLHLWSLAVEEQFYIFFPPFLILFWKKKWPLFWILAGLFVVSFVANLFMAQKNPAADFFLTPYRCWELIAGAMLAMRSFLQNRTSRYCHLYSALGIIFVLTGLVFLNKGDLYPGWRAVLPVTGTLLLIAAGPSAFINKRILSNPISIWVGLISYPLYLFHWPILSFLHILKGAHPDPGSVFIALALSFVLAFLTYVLIEKKIRYAKSRWTIPVLVAAFFISGFLGVLVWKAILTPRSSGLGFDEYVKASADMKYFAGYVSEKFSDKISIRSCGGSSMKTLYLGDSHMQQCAPRILQVVNSSNTSDRGAIFFTTGGLFPIPGVSGGETEAHVIRYNIFMPKMLELANRSDVDRVVITSNWCMYFTWLGSRHTVNSFNLNTRNGMNAALSNLERLIKDFSEKGKQVYLILNIPTSDSFDPKFLINRSFSGRFWVAPHVFTENEFYSVRCSAELTQGEIIDSLTQVASSAGAKVINPMSYLTQKGVCFRFFEGSPIYRDGSHLRASFVRDKATYLDETILP